MLNFAISDRVSYIINDVPVTNGKLAIEEFLEENLYERLENNKKVKCSEWMKRMLMEIINLQRARGKVIKIINDKQEMS